ncbi:MAG TPA: 50S ribosomal protein L10 [Candidatus Saccharimonadales bacterium]|nr:50S ribosomal protein L10 [Candidatus Saccharimonadales bacterium]
MALNKEKKAEVVAKIGELLETSKLTVIAKYPGTSVKSFQELRRQAVDNGTTVSVAKNRLVKKALESNDRFSGLDTSVLTGQLMYAFNAEDEVAPAQVLANFAKTQPSVEFVGAIGAEGQFLSAEDVQALASLPSKDQLRAQLIATVNAPLTGFVGVLSGNIRGVLNVLSARAENIS